MNPIEILHEDSCIIVVNKRPGDLVAESGDGSVVDAVRTVRPNLRGDLRVTHRIDRPASGVLILARTVAACEAVNATFRTGAPEKRYWAIVDGEPPAESAVLTHHLMHESRRNVTRVFDEPRRDTRPARLSYIVLGRTDRYVLLEVVLDTGRTHQIRAQLAHLALHIKGDTKYGAKRGNRGGGIHLHCRRITLPTPPDGTVATFTAHPPDDPLWVMFPR